MRLHPDEPLRCPLVQARFSAFSFWNFVAACETMGARTPSPPLGLLTAAALLPQRRQSRLLDLNTRPFSEEDWAWADLVCVGGMLPQQEGMLAVIDRARRDGEFVAVGGSDPTSQPHVYTASMNLADDDELLGLMRAAGFRLVFMGIETPDPTCCALHGAKYREIFSNAISGIRFDVSECDEPTVCKRS